MDALLRQDAERLAALAREEDLGEGDITSALLEDPGQPARFALTTRQPCVLAGREITPIILQAYDSAVEIAWLPGMEDGAEVQPEGEPAASTGATPPSTGVLAELSGPLGSVLAVERVLLNFLQHLCGIATLTRSYVKAVAGTDAVICDTRKTTPGWRRLEKYAVRCGGGVNHRMGLYDGVLIKDNHLGGAPANRVARLVFDMLNRLSPPPRPASIHAPFIEVEADTLEQVEALYSVVGIDAILLDNFTPDELRRAVALRNDLGLQGKVLLEASGGITLETVRVVAETGVDRISIGALTHSAPAVDLSLERLT